MKNMTSENRVGPIGGAAATYFMSSAAIMVMQLAAGRIVARYLGQSLYTWTSIIAVTLAGIAIGNYLGGRFSDQYTRRASLGLLFAVAAMAEVSVLALNWLAGHCALLAGLPWPVRIASHVFLVFLIPFTGLGMISPMITRRALRGCSAAGRTMGILYAASLAGSLLGTFLTGYVLLAWLGNQAIILLSAAGLAMIGGVYGLLRKGETAPTMISVAEQPAAHGETLPDGLWKSAAAMGLAGMAVMMVELIAARMLALSFGNSLYTWTTIIGVILAAMSLGGYAGGRLADRVAPAPLLSVLFFLAALTGLLGPLGNAILRGYPLLWPLPWPAQILAHSLLVFFTPVFFMGAIPPVIVRSAVTSVPEALQGRRVGWLYASHAVGSIMGTFAAGYVLIAALGAVPAWCIVSGLLMSAALAYTAQNRICHAGALIVGVLLMSVFSPWPAFQTPAIYLALRPWYGPEMKYVDESQYGFIAVQATDPEQPEIRKLILDKMVHNRTDLAHPTSLQYPYEWFYQAVLNRFRPEPEPLRALAIGGGGYTFCRYLELTRPESHIVVSEIDPGVTEAAYAAFGLPRDTKLEIHHIDGRNYVEAFTRTLTREDATQRFDCVFGDSFNDYSVPFHLTTKEYTQRIADLLTEDGLYLLNMIDMFDSGLFLSAMLNTCREVFPEVHVFSVGGKMDQRETFVVVCSRRKISLEGLTESINQTHQTSGVLLTLDQLAALSHRTGKMILTDDFAPVDNLLAPVVRKTEDSPMIRRLLQMDQYLARGQNEQAIHEAQWIVTRKDAPPEAFELFSTALRRSGRNMEAVTAARQAVAKTPDRYESQNCLAHALYEAGDVESAVAYWKKAESLQPNNATLQVSLGGGLLRMNRPEEAIPHLRRALDLNPHSEAARINLAGALYLKGDIAAAAETLRMAIELNPKNAAARAQLATAYWKLKAYDRAWTEVRRCRELNGALDAGFLEALRRDSGRNE